MMVTILAALLLEFGTAAVVIRTHDEKIVVAVDSKVTRSDDRTWSEERCKLHVGIDAVVVLTGLSREESLGFDLAKLVTDALISEGSVRQRVEVFRNQAIAELGRALTWARQNEPDWFAKNYRRTKKLAAQAAWVSISGDAFIEGYELSEGADRVEVHAVPVALRPRSFVFLGEDQAMFDLVSARGEAMLADPLMAAATLIDAAITQAPGLVGPPIRVVEIAGGRIRWVRGATGC